MNDPLVLIDRNYVINVVFKCAMIYRIQVEEVINEYYFFIYVTSGSQGLEARPFIFENSRGPPFPPHTVRFFDQICEKKTFIFLVLSQLIIWLILMPFISENPRQM